MKILQTDNLGAAVKATLPHGWQPKRLKFVAEVRPSNVDKHTKLDEVPVRLCNYTDVYYGEKIRFDDKFMAATATPEQVARFALRVDDVLLTKDSESRDDIGIPALIESTAANFVCGYHLALVRPRTIYGPYLKRAIESRLVASQFSTNANGLTRYGLGTYALKNVTLPFPSISTQIAIASLLDRETTRIDTLIAKQKQLIELLKKKRQAVISQAVTKGLDPDVPMKDSGVGWLGKVPSHWRVQRVKAAATSIKAGPFGSSLKKDSYTSSGVRVYGQEQVISNDFSIGNYFIGYDRYLSDFSQYSALSGDLLISCVGTFGKVALIPEKAPLGIINPRLLRIRLARTVVPEFMIHVMRATSTVGQVESVIRGGTMGVINIGTLSSIWMSLPPKNEQRAIVESVREKTKAIDDVLERASRLTVLLEERRTALISAAVTGQIDVTTYAPSSTTAAAPPA